MPRKRYHHTEQRNDVFNDHYMMLVVVSVLTEVHTLIHEFSMTAGV